MATPAARAWPLRRVRAADEAVVEALADVLIESSATAGVYNSTGQERREPPAMRRWLVVGITLMAVAALSLLVGQGASAFAGSLAVDISHVLTTQGQWPGAGSWHSGVEFDDYIRGARLAFLGLLVTAFPAGLAAIAVAMTPTLRRRRWPRGWAHVFRAGAILQGGCIAVSLVLLWFAPLSVPDGYLDLARFVIPDLVVSMAAMPAWFKLQAAVVPPAPPRAAGFAIQ
jgi:hypothetical protein